MCELKYFDNHAVTLFLQRALRARKPPACDLSRV